MTLEITSEMESRFGYKPRSIIAQIDVLRKLFPEIGSANGGLLAQIKKNQVGLPVGVEGWFAIPHWSKVGNTYQEALAKVLGLLEKNCGGEFNGYGDYRQGILIKLREARKKARAMEYLQNDQNAGIVLVPARFGDHHLRRDYSVRKFRSPNRARAVMEKQEFGFGVYETGIMILTHFNLMKKYGDMYIACLGDEFAFDFHTGFSNPFVLNFVLTDGSLRFSHDHGDSMDPFRKHDHYGSASGFLVDLNK